MILSDPLWKEKLSLIVWRSGAKSFKFDQELLTNVSFQVVHAFQKDNSFQIHALHMWWQNFSGGEIWNGVQWSGFLVSPSHDRTIVLPYQKHPIDGTPNNLTHCLTRARILCTYTIQCFNQIALKLMSHSSVYTNQSQRRPGNPPCNNTIAIGLNGSRWIFKYRQWFRCMYLVLLKFAYDPPNI